MSEPFRFLDLPKEIRCMVWQEFFLPFDIEVIQHTHKDENNDEVFEVTVHGFGPSPNLSIQRVSSQIWKDTKPYFEKAFSGKLSVLGCQYRVFDRRGRLLHILDTIPTTSLKEYFGNDTYDNNYVDLCKSCDLFGRFGAPHPSIYLSRFPNLEQVRIGVEAHLNMTDEMQQEWELQRSVLDSDNEIEHEIISAVRETVVHQSTKKSFADALSQHYAESLTIYNEDARSRYNIAENVPVTLEFFEERGLNRSPSRTVFDFYKSAFHTYLVWRVSLHSKGSIDACEMDLRPRSETYSTCNHGDLVPK